MKPRWVANEARRFREFTNLSPLYAPRHSELIAVASGIHAVQWHGATEARSKLGLERSAEGLGTIKTDSLACWSSCRPAFRSHHNALLKSRFFRHLVVYSGEQDGEIRQSERPSRGDDAVCNSTRCAHCGAHALASPGRCSAGRHEYWPRQNIAKDAPHLGQRAVDTAADKARLELTDTQLRIRIVRCSCRRAALRLPSKAARGSCNQQKHADGLSTVCKRCCGSHSSWRSSP